MQEATYPTNPTPQEGEMSFIQRIINVFVNPSTAFKAVREKPRWIWPTLLVVILGVVMTYFMQPIIVQEQMEKTTTQLEERGMSQEQIDTALEQSQKWMKYIMYPAALLGGFIVILISAAIWLFVSNTLLGGQSRYAQLLEVVSLSSLIPVLGMVVKIPIMLSKMTTNVHFSLATFMSDTAKDTFLYKFLVNTDFFNIWYIAVLCIGIAAVGGLKVKKVWPVVVILLIVWYLATAALGNLFG